MLKQFDLNIMKPPRSRMCPLGYHIVKGHQRVCASGTKTWVDTHVRKNRGKHIIYLPENLLYLYWNNNQAFKKLNPIFGYAGYHEIDSIIQFWLDYWKSIFSQLPEIDPLLIKTLIAKESSFNPLADPKVSHSSAFGLMQIVDSARLALSGQIQSSVTQHFIKVERED